ncbi:MAG: M1 family metallopeptidase [Bacteroidota bacterium]
MNRSLLTLVIFLLTASLNAQTQHRFSRADTLRGMLRPERTCFDVHYYDLEIKVDAKLRRIAGSNKIHFLAVEDFRELQLDLFANMEIAEITWQGQKLAFSREFNAVFVRFPERILKGSKQMIEVLYAGAPSVAKRPPWDGGFVWEKDPNGNDWVNVACEGFGASSWWPLKDHLSDEPDSLQFSVIYPRGAYVVSNGNLRRTEDLPGEFTKWVYFVGNPINSYNLSLQIGDYVKFTDVYKNTSGYHELKYYVLKDNKEAAVAHFKQVKGMLECFEKYFGEYPFWSDGYALVETSYWGMEHQSGIAYGNNYKNNAFDFDFIIIHESGHEWFGNSISVADHADMWVHEAFTTYMEAIYVEHFHGQEQMIAYLNTQRPLIGNKMPIQGVKDVNFEDWPDADMYYKGSWMLHTLRNIVGDDERWFAMLKQMCEDYRHSIVDSKTIIDFVSWKLGEDYSAFFAEYLNHVGNPILEYKIERKKRRSTLSYRWVANEANFNMPIDISMYGETLRLQPTTEWQSITEKKLSEKNLEFDPDWGLYEVRNVSNQ